MPAAASAIIIERKLREVTPLIYHAPVLPGGLAEYAAWQSRALAEAGARVIVLGYPDLLKAMSPLPDSIQFIALPERQTTGTKAGKLARWIRDLRREVAILSDVVNQHHANQVLFTSFAEYFSPFWFRPLKRLANRGTRFGVVVHDPVRDFRIGPRSWHQYCIRTAYSFFQTAFVHQATEVDFGGLNEPPEIVVIPHGPYEVPIPEKPESRSELRRQLGIAETSRVLLSFGHIRDGKNLDLTIRSLANVPDWTLLVVGREQSSGQKRITDYQLLAQQCGVESRCRWFNEFVPDSDVYRYFKAADALLLTYSSAFRSASGVLSLASQFGLPVLASGGAGPLKQAVVQYQLGVWIEPDSLTATQRGLEQLGETTTQKMEWDAYRHHHSWERNATIVLKHLGEANKETSPVETGNGVESP